MNSPRFQTTVQGKFIISLDFSDPKAGLLREVLASYLTEPRMQIAYRPKKELRDPDPFPETTRTFSLPAFRIPSLRP